MEFQLYDIGDHYNISIPFDTSDSDDPTLRELGEMANMLNGGCPEILTLDGTVVYVSDTMDVVRVDDCYEELTSYGVPYSFVCVIIPDFKDKYPEGGKSLLELYVIMDPYGSPLYERDMNTGKVYPFGEAPTEEWKPTNDIAEKADQYYEDIKSSCITKVIINLPEEDLQEAGKFQIVPEGLSDGLNRAHSWLIRSDCAILSAWRGCYTRKENDLRSKELQSTLRQLGYGVFNVRGCYAELGKDVTKENSFIIYPLNEESSANFKSDINELSTKYDQDCFIYKEADIESHAFLIGTNNDFGIGTTIDIGTIRLNNPKAENFTQAGHGTIAFLRGPVEKVLEKSNIL